MNARCLHGHAIRARRLEHGWSRYEFSRKSGVSVSYLKLIEADAYRPSARITAILAATLGCDIDDITGPLDDQAAA